MKQYDDIKVADAISDYVQEIACCGCCKYASMVAWIEHDEGPMAEVYAAIECKNPLNHVGFKKNYDKLDITDKCHHFEMWTE